MLIYSQQIQWIRLKITQILARPPKRILIEGAPGIGKTVLVKEIAYRWANKELLQNIELIFLIYLRDPRLREIKSTTQLLQLFTSTKVATDVADYLQECDGSGVAFVIDGFDEYPSSLQHSSLIVDIIRGEVLHKSHGCCYFTTNCYSISA